MMYGKSVLDGIWSFSFAGEGSLLRGTCPPIGEETFLAVPGCFDVAAPFFGRRGTGCFRRTVRTGGPVRLSIDGVGVEAEVFWDGRPVGRCPYAYMPERFRFDAGEYGEHELVIAVCNCFNKVFFPYYDFYAYGGIFGSVTLEELPGYAIDCLKVTTLDHRTGKIRVDVETNRFLRKGYDISFEIDGREVRKAVFSGRRQSFEFDVPGFKLWSPESPHLHRLRVTLGKYREECDIGLRVIEIKGPKLYLNGKELRLMGYNRHDSHPEFGAAVPPSLMAADLQMIKNQGCNFIRGSHYPQRKAFLDLCDKLGLLVWEETLGWDVRDKELFTREFLFSQKDQAKKLARSHYDHPCVIIWGFMNETLSDDRRVRRIVKAVYDAYKSEDATRPVTFASNRYEKDVCMDLVDIVAMNPYPGWGNTNWNEISGVHNIRPSLDALKAAIPADKPFMISETGAAAIYGHRDPYRARWSEEYQAEVAAEVCRIVLNDDRYCGLCFWHFCDALSYLNGGRVRGLNDKGFLDPYRRPKLAWSAVTEALKDLKIFGNK